MPIGLATSQTSASLDESDRLGLIKKIIVRVCARDEKLDPHLAGNFISRAKNNGWPRPQEEIARGRSVSPLRAGTSRLECHGLRRSCSPRRFNSFPRSDDVRDKWRAKVRHLMVDEFQDTNRLAVRARQPACQRPAAKCLCRGRRRPEHLRLARRRSFEHPGI